MRVVIFILLGSVSVILSGSLTSGLNIAGIQVDLLLLICVSLALLERDSVPVIFAAATGLMMDIMFSDVLGVYAICYTAVVALVLAIVRRTDRLKVAYLFVVGALGYIIKELILALVVYLLGARFDMIYMVVRYILPAAALNGALLFIVYWLLWMLYRKSWMRRKSEYEDDLMA